MQEATLCYIVDEGQVLLIEKRRGMGAGLYNGPGGKLEPGETPLEAIEREVDEEVGLVIDDPTKFAELTFIHDGDPTLFVHVFRATEFVGEATASPEARPVWFDRDSLPYDDMWDDDYLWLPRVLDGEAIAGTFAFAGGDRLDAATFVDHEIEPVPEGFE